MVNLLEVMVGEEGVFVSGFSMCELCFLIGVKFKGNFDVLLILLIMFKVFICNFGLVKCE